MGEAVERAASSLAPLMIVLGIVAGVLITMALILRIRVQRDRERAGLCLTGRPVAQRGLAQAAAGDSVAVLGRAYRVGARRELSLEQGSWLFFEMEGEEGAARLLVDLSGERALCLPGRQDAPAAGQPFPDVLERAEGVFTRLGRTAEEADGLRLALYAGPQERHLLWEAGATGAHLFRGKAVPFEGVVLLERE